MTIVESMQLNPAQQRAVQAIAERDVALVASAGTGKTYALVGCYLALLEQEVVHKPHEIVAVTFTRKAAREMRSRIRTRIAQSLQQEGASQRWAAHYHQLESARIGTIHSLCGEIIRAHVHLAAVDPLFDTLDETEAARLQGAAVSRALEWAATADEPLRELLRWLGAEDLQRWLLTMLQRRLDVEPALTEERWDCWQAELQQRVRLLQGFVNDPEVTEAFRQLAALVHQGALEQVRRQTAPDVDALVEQIPAALAVWGEMQQAAAAGDWAAVSRLLLPLRLQLGSKGRKGSWSGFAPNAKDVVKTLRDAYDPRFADWAGKYAGDKGADLGLDQKLLASMPHLRRLFRQALAFYETAKEERRALDFDDLEQTALELLQRPESAQWLDGISALLVDEYQDTNERQRRLVEQMAAGARLFVVGDAKQSIYRFRGADVAVFTRQQQAIAAAGGLRVPLQTSYRARPELVELLNWLLGGVMKPHQQYDPAEDDLQAAYHPEKLRDAGQPAPLLDHPFLELHLALGSKGDGGLRRAADGLARRLRQLVEEPAHDLSYGQIAVLCRASTSFAAYEAAFNAAGLPYIVGAGRGFYQRPEVRDGLNALRALAEPEDDLALAGLLRSPVLGFDDVALYALSQQPGRTWWHKLQKLAEDGAPRARQACETIDRLRRKAARLPAGAALHAFLDATGYRAALHLAGEDRAVRNVDKLLADAHASGQAGISSFLRHIREVQAAASREGEAPEPAVDAVRLMTVHAAKGLGFQVVVLGDVNYSGASHKSLLIGDEWGVVPPVQNGDGVRSLIYDLAAEAEKGPEEDELRRLLYVAATRARQKLILSGCFSGFKANGQPARVNGWLNWLGAELGFLDHSFQVGYDELDAIPFTLPQAPASVQGWLYGAQFRPGDEAASPTVSWPAPAPRALQQPLPVRLPVVGSGKRAWRVTAGGADGDLPGWILGSLVHDALAAWCLPGDGHFDAWLQARCYHYGLVDGAQQQQALARARDLLQRFRQNPLYARLDDTVRHHELPYYTNDPRFSFSKGESAAMHVVDLLYRDPADGRWVVLDFKSDPLAGHRTEQALQRWAAEEADYADQLRAYAAAVQALLQLDYRPRCQLCLLDCPGEDNVRRLQLLNIPDEG